MIIPQYFLDVTFILKVKKKKLFIFNLVDYFLQIRKYEQIYDF